MKKIFLLLSACTIAAAACTKHADDVAETPAPMQFTFTAPAASSSFRIGDSVTFHGVAIAPATLHGYDLVIKKAFDTSVYFKKHVHDHNDTLVVNQKWKAEVNTPANLEAQITFALDHDGNTYTKKVVFTVQ